MLFVGDDGAEDHHDGEGQDFVAHAEQAARKWGETKEFAQRQRRTAGHTQQDWQQLREELAAINQGLAEAMLAGAPATDPVAMGLAERSS